MLRRPPRATRTGDGVRGALAGVAGEVVRQVWDLAVELGAIGPDSRAGRRFGAFGAGSVICFPATSILNPHAIRIGADTVIGPSVTLSAGMSAGQELVRDPIVRIGDRCVVGRGSGIVGHLSIEIGDEVWTGHHVFVTDQNHGYEDLTQSIARQVQPERPVSIGDGSWLGHGVIVLPGARIGRHVAVAAGSVVTGDLPDRCLAAGAPARPIRRHLPGLGWVPVPG